MWLFECWKIELRILLLYAKIPNNLQTFKTMENFEEIWLAIAWSETLRVKHPANTCIVVFAGINQKKLGLNSGTKYLNVRQGILGLEYFSLILTQCTPSILSFQMHIRLEVSTFNYLYTDLENFI